MQCKPFVDRSSEVVWQAHWLIVKLKQFTAGGRILTGDYHREWGYCLKMPSSYDSPGFSVFDW